MAFKRPRRALVLLAAIFVARLLPAQPLPSPPPLGILVDAGGYRVHLYCTGAGSPTVFIAGGFSFDWALVQPQIAKLAKVCTYDVAGTAWSDPGPSATCQDRVNEIHNVILNAPIERPFVLAGFSIGALVARRYAANYPGEIAGMVIVDHAFLPPEDAQPPPPTANGPPVLIFKTPIEATTEESSHFANLPPRDRDLQRWAESRQPRPDTAKAAQDCADQLKATDRLPHPLGQIPLVVVSTANTAPGYAGLQTKLLSLSSNSRHLVAENSFHSIEIDQPDVVVAAIREVLQALARHPPGQ